MCKANNAIEAKVAELVSLLAMADDLNNEIESLKDEVKAYMDENDADEMQSGDHIVSYKPVSSKRIDTTALKKLLGDALEPYFKVTVAKRFSIK